jgi:hypothetical protein
LDIYEVLGYLIVWFVPPIILFRLRKEFYALYIESRDDGGLFSTVLNPIRQWVAFRKSHKMERIKWAEEVIEQEKYRKSST